MNMPLALDVVGSWLIPGLGFFRRGRYARAIALFLVIEGTFCIGLFLNGSVTPPILDFSGGGIISILTFLIQLANGLVSILSLGAHFWSGALVNQGLVPGQILKFFSGIQTHAFFELGGFYLLVSGAMNYFAVINFYDRYKPGGKGGNTGEEKSEKC